MPIMSCLFASNSSIELELTNKISVCESLGTNDGGDELI